MAERAHGLVFLLMAVFIFINPFPHVTALKELTIYGSAAALLLLLAFKKTGFSFQSPLLLPFALFTAWALLGLFTALDRGNSLHDLRAHWVRYVLVYFLLLNFFASRQRFRLLVGLVIVSSLLFAVGNLVYFYGILGYDLKTRLGMHLVQIQTNLIGPLLVSALLFAAQLLREERDCRQHWALIAALVGMGLAAAMTQSRGTVLALLIGMGILFWDRKKYILLGLLILALVIVSSPRRERFLISTMLHNERFSIGLVSLGIIRDYPLFGIGFGMEIFKKRDFLKPYYEQLPERYARSKIDAHPHNIFLDTGVRTGVVGLGLFLFLLARVFAMAWKATRAGEGFVKGWGRCLAACFAALLFQGLFDPTLHGPPAILLFTLMAMITILWRWKDQPSERL